MCWKTLILRVPEKKETFALFLQKIDRFAHLHYNGSIAGRFVHKVPKISASAPT